jgi:fibronectin-binding autotransporter adhesin
LRCPGWQRVNDVFTDVTLDMNHNGKIDRILVQTTLPLTRSAAAFSGFVVNVPGYALDTSAGSVPGSPFNWTDPYFAAHLDEFWIMLKEQTYLDTGALPAWTVVSDSTLSDSATGTFFVPLGPPPPLAPLTDAAPPILGYTLAVANGQPQIYLHFSEPVFHVGGGPPQNQDFVLHNIHPGEAISGLPAAPVPSVSPTEYLLALTAPLTPDDIAFPATVTASVASNGAGKGLQDAAPNQLTEAVGTGHRVSDLSLGVSPNTMMEPIFAHDETQSGPFPGGIGLVSLGGFDGSKWLRNRQTITLEGRIPGGGPPSGLTALPALGTTTLLYDIDVTASLRYAASPTGVWLPPFIDDVTVAPPFYGFSGLVGTGNSGDAQVRSQSEQGSSTLPLRDYQIPSTESKDHDGAVVDFLFKMTFPGQTILGARVAGPTAAGWYATVTPWTFDLRDIRTQRGGVQILKNVINPDKGEVTTLQFIQGTAGNVTVTVFDLSGSIIRVLVRQNQAAGDYGVTWDGTNRSGAKVTRGLYFIKVVGPGMDEIRKVLVVR